jgi:lysozyme
MTALDIAASLSRRFEGLRLRPYLCPAGFPSIGFGARTYLDGRQVRMTDPAISEETAERLLLSSLQRVYLPAAQKLCPRADESQLGALADFCLNIGPARLASSTLRRKFNRGDIAGARAELQRWVYGGGKKLPGLVLRRKAEAALL